MKGFSYMIEMAIVVFIFIFFAFSVLSYNQPSEMEFMLMERKIDRVIDFLEMTGKLRELSCLKRTSQLEAEMDRYLDYGFDVSICSGDCSPYVSPKNRDVFVYRRFLYGCYSDSPRLVRVFAWLKR